MIVLLRRTTRSLMRTMYMYTLKRALSYWGKYYTVNYNVTYSKFQYHVVFQINL